jgi:hypothetical protein
VRQRQNLSDRKSPAANPLPSRGIPDLQYIKKRLPIADVARALDLRVANATTAHCWRVENHEHGDRTPSLWFSRRSNKAKCYVCDRFCFSNLDLVQFIRGGSTAEAINWIASQFEVPRIAKKHLARNGAPRLGRAGTGSRLEKLIRAGVWAALTGPVAKLLVVLDEFSDPTGRLSYRALQRLTGIGSRTTIKTSLDTLEHLGLLKIDRSSSGDGLQALNGYRLDWDDADLQRLMLETYRASTREIAAQIELRRSEREGRSAYLGTTSVHSVDQWNDLLVHSTDQQKKQGREKGPKSETCMKGTKDGTA